ncbi:MAG: hypothetical protein OEW49_00630 [Nitrosopumilus sp.]|nr:hypothetical protein [Nitrosopumilus sp.]
MLAPAYGQLSDATGLVNRLNVETGGYAFEVEVVSNFDISDFKFNMDEKRLTLHINSGLQNNLGEMQIPQGLLGGDLTFNLNDQQFFPKIKSNDKISFVTLNFTGTGNNKLDIFGSTYLSGLTEREQKESINISEESEDNYLWWLVLAGSLSISGFIIIKKRKKPLTK